MAAVETSPPRDLGTTRVAGLLAILFVALLTAERQLGRHFVSSAGFGVWTGAWTPRTSQWIADPYTFTHVLHGIGFYYLLLPTRRWLSVGSRFLIASLIEVSWEILENTPFIIDRYRDATVSLDYYGDSILNSTFDLIAAMSGFGLAWKFDWKWVVAFAVTVELVLLCLVRDNLALNIVMLLFPSEAIKQWQLGQ